MSEDEVIGKLIAEKQADIAFYEMQIKAADENLEKLRVEQLVRLKDAINAAVTLKKECQEKIQEARKALDWLQNKRAQQ